METKTLFKIPQHPYDGDTFAITIIPNEQLKFGTGDSSYALNNEQPENSNTGVFYRGKLWKPNEIIPLTLTGHGIKGPETEEEGHWEITYKEIIEKKELDVDYLHIIMVLDDSGSMSGTRWRYLKEADSIIMNVLNETYSNMLDKIFISTISLKDTYKVGNGIVRKRTSLQNNSSPSSQSMSADGGTYYENALKNAIYLMNEEVSLNPDRQNIIFMFITDGEPLDNPEKVRTIWETYKTSMLNSVFIGISLSYTRYGWITKTQNEVFFYRDAATFRNDIEDILKKNILVEYSTRIVEDTRTWVVDKEATSSFECHIRTIQYFTYFKIIDAWICYWQYNICTGTGKEQEKVKIVIQFRRCAGIFLHGSDQDTYQGFVSEIGFITADDAHKVDVLYETIDYVDKNTDYEKKISNELLYSKLSAYMYEPDQDCFQKAYQYSDHYNIRIKFGQNYIAAENIEIGNFIDEEGDEQWGAYVTENGKTKKADLQTILTPNVEKYPWCGRYLQAEGWFYYGYMYDSTYNNNDGVEYDLFFYHDSSYSIYWNGENFIKNDPNFMSKDTIFRFNTGNNKTIYILIDLATDLDAGYADEPIQNV